MFVKISEKSVLVDSKEFVQTVELNTQKFSF